MIIIECAQGSEEWHRARAGVITASMFSVARKKVNGLTAQQAIYVDALKSGTSEKVAMERAGYKATPRADVVSRALAGERVGEFSEEAKNYAFRLAVERISGEPLDEGFETWSMRRGHDLEPRARMEHELQAGIFVERAGFVKTDDGAFGASADGLIGDEDASEYKCFLAPEKLRAFHIDNDTSSIKDQVQGVVWITGRKRIHSCLYCPALESVGKQLWWQIIERDDDYIEAMEVDLWEFKLLVDEYEQTLRLKEAA